MGLEIVFQAFRMLFLFGKSHALPSKTWVKRQNTHDDSDSDFGP